MMGLLEGAFDALNDVLKKSVPPNVYRSWTSGARALGELSPGAAIRDVKEESGAMVDAAREGRWLDAGAGPAKMAVAMAGIVPPIRAARVASRTAAPIRGYHGSPHDFAAERLVKLPDGRTEYIVGAPDRLPVVPPRATVLQDFPLGRFRADKVGTGEGAQVYGHGAAYIAENEGVARTYRDNVLSRIRTDPKAFAASQLDHYGGDRDKAIAATLSILGPPGSRHNNVAEEALRWLRSGSPVSDLPRGKMYEVNLHADPKKFLDWDKPLSQQSPEVQERLHKAWLAHKDDHAHQTGGQIYESSRIVPGDYRDRVAASNALRDAGIPGIKYLDAGSRSSGAGSSNYVPFDESILEILRKYGLLPAAAAGAGAAAVPGLLSPTQEY